MGLVLTRRVGKVSQNSARGASGLDYRGDRAAGGLDHPRDPALNPTFWTTEVATPRVASWIWAAASGGVPLFVLRWPAQLAAADFLGPRRSPEEVEPPRHRRAERRTTPVAHLIATPRREPVAISAPG
jgi:hypothetical protein